MTPVQFRDAVYRMADRLGFNRKHARPSDWQGHYHGDPQQQKLLRLYSYSDRIPYYWNEHAVETAVTRLMENLECADIPLAMLSRYLPEEYAAVRNGVIGCTQRSLFFIGFAACSASTLPHAIGRSHDEIMVQEFTRSLSGIA